MGEDRDDQATRVRDVFDEWADAGRGERMETGHRPTAGRVLDAIPLQDGDRFLDLGTGNGWAARDAARRGARAVGVDLAGGMLRRARSHGGSVDYVRCRFEDLPFRDASITRAFGMESVYYAGDVDAALREVTRVLAAGGTLDAVLDYYEENPASHGWPEMLGVRMHLASEDGWRRLFERAGFRDVRTTRIRTPKGVGDEWLHEHGSLHVHGSK